MTAVELKRLRQERGWSQKETAERVGVTYKTIKRWEERGVPDYRVQQTLKGFGLLRIDSGYVEAIERDEYGMPLRCAGCAYRHGFGMAGICNYNIIENELRGTSVKDCTHYREGIIYGRDLF